MPGCNAPAVCSVKENLLVSKSDIRAEVLLPTDELLNDLPFYTDTLGMRLDSIYPADDPAIACLSGHGLNIRIDKTANVSPGELRILTDDVSGFAGGLTELVAPNGTVIKIAALTPRLELPATQHEFAVRRLRDEAPWIIGRAGMHYRDLIPSRLGGSIIASHIRIPDGGPVPDTVHYHTVGFQLIYCLNGWVDVLYEDQGDMIRLTAGDCVTQPPQIRHRVCYASADIEVLEIGVPAEHVTTIDHDFVLPNGKGDPDRQWDEQKFVHHVVSTATWRSHRIPGFECRDTGVKLGTNGVAGIEVARYRSGNPPKTSNDADIHFTFVIAGRVCLNAEEQEPRQLEAGDAFVVPPGVVTQFTESSNDLELLEVSLRGDCRTVVHA